MREISFKETRQLQLEILQEFATFCSTHGLRYYIAYGTLLGAVRHKGFIPWDDDIDVMMPLEDFEKFCQMYSSDNFIVSYCKIDKLIGWSFGRLINNKTCRILGQYQDTGVNIDIYPIYGMPDSKEEQKKHLVKLYRSIKVSDFLVRVRSKLARLGLWPFKTLDFALNTYILKKQVKLLEKYRFDESNYAYINCGHAVYPKKYLETDTNLSFEGMKFSAPSYYHEVLTMMYGDYMQLPPVEQRVPYHGSNYYWK